VISTGNPEFKGLLSRSRSGLTQPELVVAVTRPNGDRLELPPLPGNATIRDLKVAIKQHLGIPCMQQQFVFGIDKLDASDTELLHTALQTSGLTSPSADTPTTIELGLVCVRPPPHEQDKLDKDLLIATAAGQLARMEAALLEGASPGCCAAGCQVREASTPEKSQGIEDLNGGADVVQTLGADLTPLLLAAAARDEEAISLLGNYSSENLELPEMVPKSRHIGIAFRYRDFADVVRFLACGADPNTRLPRGLGVQDTNHGTLLHACCAMHTAPGAEALVELLLRLGANLEAPDAEGDPPLAHARYFGANDLYQVLQTHGARLTGPYYTRFSLGIPLRMRM